MANNLALRDLDGVDYVGLVNADSFVEPGWLRAAGRRGIESDDGLGAVSARLLFADRFVEVAIDLADVRPPGPDPRALGVRVSGVRVDGVDRWRDAQVADGGWGIEHRPDGTTFQWTAAGHPPGAGRRRRGACRTGSRWRWPPSPPSGWPSARAARRARWPSGSERRWHEPPVAGPPVDIVNNVGSVLIEGGYGADRGYLEPDEGQYDAPADVFAWCGGSVLLRPAYLADVGLFDERVLPLLRGHRPVVAGPQPGLALPLRARGPWCGTSTPRRRGRARPVFQHYVERNRLLMLAKNAPAGDGRPRRLALPADHAVLRPARRRGPGARAATGPGPTIVVRRLRSFVDFLRLLPAILAERRRVRRRATVGDAELLAWAVRR